MFLCTKLCGGKCMHPVESYHEYYTVITNGEVEFEIKCSKYSCGIDPGDHIFGQDGNGHYFIDGKPAHIEMRERKYA